MLYGFKENKCKDEVLSKEETLRIISAEAGDAYNKYVSKTIEIPHAGGDIDNLKTEGRYFYNSANTPLNAPVTGINGWLEVMQRNTDNTTVIKQIWYTYGTKNHSDTESYIRTFMEDGWSDWAKVMTTRDYIILNGKLVMTDGVAEKTFDLPNGIKSDECVVLSYMQHHTAETSYYAYGYLERADAYTVGVTGTCVTLNTNNTVTIKIQNPTSSTSGSGDFTFKLVLMKLPKTNVSGYQLGDVNMDGEITQADADLALAYYAGNAALTDKQIKLADVNGDGKVLPQDSTLIQNMIESNS